MPHPPVSHIRGANKCAQSFVVPSQDRLTRTHRAEITDLKTCKWILIPPLVGFCLICSSVLCSEVLLLLFNCGTLSHQHLVRLKAIALVFVPIPIWTDEEMPWPDYSCLQWLLVYCWGNCRRTCGNDQSCVLRRRSSSLQDEPYSFLLSATIWILQFRAWPL